MIIGTHNVINCANNIKNTASVSFSFLIFRQKKNTSNKGVFSKKSSRFRTNTIDTKILFAVPYNAFRRTTPSLSVIKFCKLIIIYCILSSYRACVNSFTHSLYSVLSKIITSSVRHDVRRFCDDGFHSSHNNHKKQQVLYMKALALYMLQQVL